MNSELAAAAQKLLCSAAPQYHPDMNLTLEKLARGLSNDNYLLSTSSQLFLLKRYREAFPAKALQAQQQLAGLALTTAPLVWCEEDKLALFEYWRGEIYQGRDWQVLIMMLRTLHQHQADNRAGVVMDLSALLASLTHVEQLIASAKRGQLAERLRTYPSTLGFCHNDLVIENILFDGEDFRLIDFEFAGYNDIYFDFAALTVSLALQRVEAEAMLSHYFATAAYQQLNMEKLTDYRQAYLLLCVDWYSKRGHKGIAADLTAQLYTW
ncbi:phosphotransferase [Pseudoalteromonas fenneropenaei]|uniref:Phosphotransferase n=1 Tax=Pseudoalteromonas fenneropenaei TaxID=1737459 RepID=A0ABV7CLU5_9GAMM